MKRINGFVVPLVLIVIAVIAVMAWWFVSKDTLQDAVSASALAVSVNGQVERINQEKAVLGSLTKGDAVVSGEGVKTGATSSATLKFDDESLLLISENSEVLLSGLLKSATTGETDTLIHLESGSVESRVTPVSGFNPRYKVVTPALQLAVRGTVFLVKVDKQTGLTSSSVIEGEVAASASGETISLKAGYFTSAKAGEPPVKPQQLPGAPANLQLADKLIRMPVSFDWQPQSDAASYQVQIYSGDKHENLAFEGSVAEAKAVITALTDDNYLVKVKAVSQQGMAGLPVEKRFVLDAHPLPPSLISPTDEVVNQRKKTRFFWESSPEAANYWFQVSETDSFEQVLSEVAALPGNMTGISIKLKPGDYYWRVASIDKDGEKGPFSDVRAFSLKSE